MIRIKNKEVLTLTGLVDKYDAIDVINWGILRLNVRRMVEEVVGMLIGRYRNLRLGFQNRKNRREIIRVTRMQRITNKNRKKFAQSAGSKAGIHVDPNVLQWSEKESQNNDNYFTSYIHTLSIYQSL